MTTNQPAHLAVVPDAPPTPDSEGPSTLRIDPAGEPDPGVSPQGGTVRRFSWRLRFAALIGTVGQVVLVTAIVAARPGMAVAAASVVTLAVVSFALVAAEALSVAASGDRVVSPSSDDRRADAFLVKACG